jgi:type II secretory pathway component PulF
VKKFGYIAKNSKGERIVGEIKARDEQEAIDTFRRDRSTLIKLVVLSDDQDILPRFFSAFRENLRRFGRPWAKPKDFAVLLFTQQISAMLEAGVDFKSGVRAILMAETDERFKEVLFGILKALEEGKSLNTAFSLYPEVFSKVYSSLVKVGIISGDLPAVLRKHAYDLEKLYNFKRKVVATLTYPAAIFFTALVFLMIIVLYFVPRFTALYNEAETRIPLITSVLVNTVKFFTNPFSLSVISLLSLIIFLVARYYIRTPIGRYNFDYLKLRMPVLGALIFENQFYLFCINLACMLECAVPVMEALKISRDMTQNEIFREIIDQIMLGIKEGNAFSDVIKGHRMIPRYAYDMIQVGEVTSELPYMVRKAAEFTEGNVNQKLETALKLLEPMVMAVLAVFAGFILVATFFPLYDVINRFTI